MNEIERAKAIFLTDVDEETYKENLQRITEWERTIQTNESYLMWREHPITQEITQKAREAYRDLAIALAENRSLTEEQRKSLWARQDACMFILSHTDKDARGTLENVLREVRRALNVTT